MKKHHDPSYPVKDSYRDAARNTTTNQLPTATKQTDSPNPIQAPEQTAPAPATVTASKPRP